MNILEVKDLTKYYGKILGIKDLTFTLKEGEILGFIGSNGAGKSTTIHLIMNLISKTSGTILFCGKKIEMEDLEMKKVVGYLPSEINLYDDLTVGEMLNFHEEFYKKNIHNRRVELVKKFKLDENKKIGDLSLGNKKKLGIVLAFMHRPKLLILDEPTSGLDPMMQNIFFDLLREEKKKGTTILYSSHMLNEVSKICDRICILKEGKLIKIEKIDEIKNKNLKYVTIRSNEIDKIVEDLNLDITLKNNNEIKFKNDFSKNNLIKKISKYKIDDILIEEASLDDILIHYYN